MSKIKLSNESANSKALFALLQTAVPLSREQLPELTSPQMPENYAEVKSGISRMADRCIAPESSGARRTSSDDVAREFEDLLRQAHRRGLPFQHLPAVLEYDEAMTRVRSQRDQYLRSADAKAAALALAVQDWTDDLGAVLQLKQVVGLEVMQEAGEATNKLIAGSALRMFAEEKLNGSAAAGLPVLAAGRGLMLLRDAGIAVGALTLDDLEQVFALAGLSIVPETLPSFGLSPAPLEFRLMGSAVKVNQRAAVLYRNAETGTGSSMLPKEVLAAASAKALAEEQEAIESRLASTPHRFAEQAEGSSSLAAARRRNLSGLGEYAATLK